MGEILALLKGEKISCAGKVEEEILRYPVLIISDECVFSKSAKNLWSKVADEAGIDLHVVLFEEEHQGIQGYSISGIPCLAAGPGENYYGLHYSHSEAKSILLTTRLRT